MKIGMLKIVEKIARRSAFLAANSQSDWWCYQTKVPPKLHKAK